MPTPTCSSFTQRAQRQRCLAGLRHRDARHDLSALLDRAGQSLHRARLDEAAGGIAQLETVQVDVQALGDHQPKPSRAARVALSSPLFARSHRPRQKTRIPLRER
jgi:hypothetical protein